MSGYASGHTDMRLLNEAACNAEARTPGPRRVWASAADAIGIILLLDAVVQLLPGRSSIAFVFFDLPSWTPLRPIVPALLGAAVLMRVRAAVAAGIVLAFWNALGYLAMLREGRIEGALVPFSYVVAMALVPALFVRRRAPVAGIVAAAVGLVLAHVLTFGATDYRRGADAIVVLGARAYSDGGASQCLLDRTMTGVQLWQAGYAPKLIFSGGDNEPDVMRRLAMESGVPEEAIVQDRSGVNTGATMDFLRTWEVARVQAEGEAGDGAVRSAGRARFLGVSNDFHNARIRLLAERHGVNCVTVPAYDPVGLRWWPYYVARECAALPVYYLTRR